MKIGYHLLEESYDGPPFAAAVALDPDEWGRPRGHLRGAASPMRLVRPYFKGNPDPAWFAARARQWREKGWRVQVGNEPNHPIEEWNGGPAAYRAFFAEVRRLAPGVKLYWAGMSPSIEGWQEWYEGAEAADGIAAHAYGAGEELRGPVWYLRQRFPAIPLWLAEVNFGPGPGRLIDRNAWAHDELRPFLSWCAALGVEALSYFAWKWPNPDMQTPTPVDAADTEIARVLSAWQGTAPPLPVPTPPPTGGSPVTIHPDVQDPRPQFADVFYRVKPAANKAGGYYRVKSLTVEESGNVIVIGHATGGPAAVWHFCWPEGNVRAESGAACEMGPGAKFTTPNGGPHWVYAGDDPAKSESVHNIGLPAGHHTVFRITWEFVSESAPPSPPPAPGPVPPPPVPVPGSVSWGKITWALEATARLLEGEGLTREAAWLLNSDGYIAARARRG